MSAVRYNVAKIACGRAAHTGFVLPVAAQMFRCRGGGLSRAQCVTTRESFYWVDVIFLPVALGSLSLILPLGYTGLHGRGWDDALKLFRECRLAVMEAVSLVCELFGAFVLAVDAAPYFQWYDARQHVEVWGSGWKDSCYETGCLITGVLGPFHDAWNGPRLDSNTPPRRDIVLSPLSSWCGGTRPSSSHAASSRGCFGRRVLHESS